MRLIRAVTKSRGWELSLEGDIHAQFDIDSALDNIGWDGWYSLLDDRTDKEPVVEIRLASQIGATFRGEFAQKTGRQRIGYTRQEIVGAISWLSNSRWRTVTHAEYGYGKLLGNTIVQKPGRVQVGLEWQPPKTPQGGNRGWYAAADLSAMQERDWQIDVALQAGYRIDTMGKNWRFGVDLYNGRLQHRGVLPADGGISRPGSLGRPLIEAEIMCLSCTYRCPKRIAIRITPLFTANFFCFFFLSRGP